MTVINREYIYYLNNAINNLNKFTKKLRYVTSDKLMYRSTRSLTLKGKRKSRKQYQFKYN